MTQPATTPTWATDATFSSGPKSGSNTKVTPSAGALSQGDVPGQPYRSERKNWLFYWTCQWIAYLKNLATDAFFLGQTYAWTAQHTWTTEYNYATPPSRVTALNLHHTVQAGGTALTWSADGAVVTPVAGVSDQRTPFKVPVGATITAVGASYTCGTTGVTLTLKLMARGKVGTGSSHVQVGSTHTLTGVTGTQALVVSGLTEVATDSTWYWLEIGSTDTSGAGTTDTATVTWTNPGPRSSVG